MDSALISLANKLGVDPDSVTLSPRNFSTDSRKKMADKGTAMPDGSYPIPDVDALKRAIQAVGRAPAGKRAAVIAHIKKRAAALGATNLIPDDWK